MRKPTATTITIGTAKVRKAPFAFVTPGHACLHAGDVVTIDNRTGAAIEIVFADRSPLQPTPRVLEPGRSQPFTVRHQREETCRVVEYAVICRATGTFAHAASNPKLIVYP